MSIRSTSTKGKVSAVSLNVIVFATVLGTACTYLDGRTGKALTD